MTSFQSVNPYTTQQFASYDLHSDAELDLIMNKAVGTQILWKELSVENRGKLFLNLSSLIKRDAGKLAEIAVNEMGKTFKEAKAEVLKCARGCEFYAEHAANILKSVITKTEDKKEVHIVYEPLGIVLGIFPWNFPYWQIIRSAAPVLMSGNAMLVKPAPNVPQCALALKELFMEAGFPAEVMQLIFVDEEQVEKIIADDRIKACTLTGSEKAGSAVASTAAKYIKKSVLELGGSDPFIVLEDADLKLVLQHAISARFQNNGQSCIAAKRFILHHKIAQYVITQLIYQVEKLKLGNPMLSETDIGPIARKDLLDKLSNQVDSSVKDGAEILYQLKDVPDHGYFYPPTIISGITKNCVAYNEELFGPVLSVYIINSDEEAVQLANDTSFGLGASVWTKDPERAKWFAKRVEAGNVFINNVVRSDPRFPFGGVKRSGFGRELGANGMTEFCNIKTVVF